MYKIREVQLLINREGYIPPSRQRNYNELELLPGKDSQFNTVLQAGIITRRKARLNTKLKSYKDYQALESYFLNGEVFPWTDPYGTIEKMIILELNEPVRALDGKHFETDITIVEVA